MDQRTQLLALVIAVAVVAIAILLIRNRQRRERQDATGESMYATSTEGEKRCPEMRNGQPLDGSDVHQLRCAPARLSRLSVERPMQRPRLAVDSAP